MPNRSKSFRLRYLIQTCLVASLSSPVIVNAQNTTDPEVEEVVVTGSYIRNSKFAQNSPVDTVSQEDLYQSGAPNMGQYIRDLTYTQNTNTVANVNAGADGGQSATGATFNLRGLGENSTLTLIDGVRSVDTAVSSLVPDIAIARMEVVLDGGSALYGSDAVAGVVNLIPVKEFDGIRARAYYQRDEDGGMEEPALAMLFGRSFDNGVNWVGAVDYKKRTPLMMYERPRTLDYAYGWANSGMPGVWREAVGAKLNVGGLHGGTLKTTNLRDPSCGAFANSPAETSLSAPLNNQSGIKVGASDCYMNYAVQWPLADGMEEYNVYQNVTYDAADWLQLEATVNLSYRENDSRQTGSYQQNANNRTALLVPGNHPANSWKVDLSPWLWRPIATAGTLPSHIEGSTGARLVKNSVYTDRWKLGARFDMSDTWTGYSYYSRQTSRRDSDQKALSLPRMQLALAGKGGASGKLYFNPFGSSDPRSPFYVAGVTDNSQEVVDWIHDLVDNVRTDTDELEIFEVTITGELFDLPAGAVSMATGYQMRDYTEYTGNNPFALIGQDYGTSIADSAPKNNTYYSNVKAAFMEFEAPVLETLTAQLAVRHERFGDFGLDATTPKVALRWEALPTLAIRTSWGESFLAPTATSARPFDPNEGCGEIFFGADPITGGVLNGGATCSSGNPTLQPETSTIKNIGFTWEPDEALSVSLDYQSIKYVDRIRTLTTDDAVGLQFQQMLAGIGATTATYNRTPGSATRNAANAWLAANAGGASPGVIRDASTQQVIKVIRQAANISSVWIDLFDMRTRYTYDTDDWGTFEATLTGSYYTDYRYEDLTGGVKDALGKQNAITGIVPPLPKVKGNLRLNWFMGQHSAAVSANYTHHVKFDDQVNNLLTGYKADRLIESQTTVNAQYAYVFTDYFDSEITVSTGISNLFNQLPQRFPILGGFESRLQSPWGRQFWVSLDWQPGV